jgi:succinoglycan biosynthesis transport protein ExoP
MDRPGQDGMRTERRMSQIGVKPIEVGILSAIDAVRRRRVLFFGSLATLLVAATVAVFAIPPRYTAVARIMIDPRAENVVSIQQVLSRLNADDPTIQSEIEVLRSEDTARRVIAQTDLIEVTEFNPLLSSPLIAGLIENLNWPWLSAAFGTILAEPVSRERERRIPGGIVEAYLARLDVAASGRNSRVIAVEFTSENPKLAARVANTLAETYIAQQVESKLAATERAALWLNDRLSELGDEVTASEEAVADIRAQTAAQGLWNAEIIAQQISQVNAELVRSRAEREQARAELAQIDSIVAEGGAEAVFEAVDPQLLVWTNEQLMWLRRSAAELKAQHGPDDPVVIEIEEAMDQLIQDTSARLAAGVRNRVRVADDKVGALENQLRALIVQSIAAGRGQARLRAAEREAQASTELYETLLTRSKETAQTGLEQPDAKIIAHAVEPHRPSFPNRVLLLGVALIGSVAVSGALVGAAESMEKGYRSADRLTRDLSLRILGETPWVSKKAQRARLAELPLNEPASAYAEALRGVALSLEMSAAEDQDAKMVLVTSSLPQEGKTTLVTGLARSMAVGGRKVLVVDCDLRRPNCHRQLQLNQGPGLSEYLSKATSVTEVIQRDRAGGVDLIAAGSVVDNPLQLLRSDRFRDLLRDMGPSYDTVLIDSPPTLPIADARLLSALADRCVLVVQWRKTAREYVTHAAEQLTQAAGHAPRVVLTQAKDRTSHGYAYYYSAYRAALDARA